MHKSQKYNNQSRIRQKIISENIIIAHITKPKEYLIEGNKYKWQKW